MILGEDHKVKKVIYWQVVKNQFSEEKNKFDFLLLPTLVV